MFPNSSVMQVVTPLAAPFPTSLEIGISGGSFCECTPDDASTCRFFFTCRACGMISLPPLSFS